MQTTQLTSQTIHAQNMGDTSDPRHQKQLERLKELLDEYKINDDNEKQSYAVLDLAFLLFCTLENYTNNIKARDEQIIRILKETYKE